MPKIENENQFLTSIKGYNSVLICRNLPICNPKTHLPNINSYTMFEENWLKNAPGRELKRSPDGLTDERSNATVFMWLRFGLDTQELILATKVSNLRNKSHLYSKMTTCVSNCPNFIATGVPIGLYGQTDGWTFGRTDGRTLEPNFLNRGYNIIPHTF